MRSILEPKYIIGVDIGKSSSCSAIVVAQIVDSEEQDEKEIHIVYLERFELNTKIREVINRLHFIWSHSTLGPYCPLVVSDASGSGGQLVYSRLYNLGIRPIIGLTVTSTGKANNSAGRVPKHVMVENLVRYFQQDIIKIAYNLKNNNLLFDEMRGYKCQPSPKAVTTKYRPTGRNGHDDLIDCISMITWVTANFKLPLWAREAEGLYPQSSTRSRPISGNRGKLRSNLSKSLYARLNPDFARHRGWN